MSAATDPGRYARATELAHALLDLPAAERSAAIERECAADSALRAEVEWMLRAAESGDEQDAAFAFDRALLDEQTTLTAPAPREYRLLQPLGEGGMGMVWLAERNEEGVPQRVALKLLRLAGSPAGLRRFRDEQRILAGLAHDNIARFIDAGALADGRPFLAVEYVDGISIDQWCPGRPLEECIGMFLKVCAAVSHAHAQLVIHRDIKPGNILVTAQGQPKLLDFGIARLIDVDDARTQTAARAMTPAYASPEQIEGGALGTTTDVYSLGAVLYEIVAGTRPFGQTQSDLALSRAIAAGDLTPPSRLARVPADIEAIVLKAMRCEPNARYASVADLAADLRRYLASEPVSAREGSRLYRARRFAWRHRFALAASAAAVVLLSAFVATTLVQLRRVQVERERIERVNQFFNAVLAAGDPADLGRRDVTVAEALDRAHQRTESLLDDDPAIVALTELTLAHTLQQIGHYGPALRSAERAIAAAERANDESTEIEARLVGGVTLWNQGRYTEATAALMRARSLAERAGTDVQRGDIANRLGEVEFSSDRLGEARRWQEHALAILPESALKQRAYALGDLASIELREGRMQRALDLNAQSIDLLRQWNPRGGVALVTQLGNRGAILTRTGDYEGAHAALDESLVMKIALYGEQHRTVVDTLMKLAQLHIEQDDAIGALPFATRADALAAPMDNYVTARAKKKYAQVLSLLGHHAEALEAARASVRLYAAHYPDDYGERLDADSVLGWAESRAGDSDVGRARARTAFERLLASRGAGHSFTADAQRRLDEIATRSGAAP